MIPELRSQADALVHAWESILVGGQPPAFDALLEEGVTLYSPLVRTPLRGRSPVTRYLNSAFSTLAVADASGKEHFRVLHRTVDDAGFVIAFETSIADTYVNGVDVVRVGPTGLIGEIRVMVRPFDAVALLHDLFVAGNAID